MFMSLLTKSANVVPRTNFANKVHIQPGNNNKNKKLVVVKLSHITLCCVAAAGWCCLAGLLTVRVTDYFFSSGVSGGCCRWAKGGSKTPNLHYLLHSRHYLGRFAHWSFWGAHLSALPSEYCPLPVCPQSSSNPELPPYNPSEM